MKASQIRQTLQAIDMLEPALDLKKMDLEEQAEVLELLEQQGKSIETVNLRQLSVVIKYHHKLKARPDHRGATNAL
jgi:hypothetical protein